MVLDAMRVLLLHVRVLTIAIFDLLNVWRGATEYRQMYEFQIHGDQSPLLS